MKDGQRVYVAQVLCPKRHCIVAQTSEAELALLQHPGATNAIIQLVFQQVDSAIAGTPHETIKALGIDRMNPWCGICSAPRAEWRVEVAITDWHTLEEAMPHLRAAERAQAMSRACIEHEKGKAANN